MRTKKKSLLRRILPWAITLILLAALVVFVGIPLYATEETEELNPPVISYYEGNADTLIMENDELLFEMDSSTTQFRLTDKQTGKVWLSNPADAASDPIALSANKATLSSTLIVTFTTNSGEVEYNNYTYSIANQTYTVTKQEDGSIRVDYSVGQIEKQYLLPVAITKVRFDAFTEQMKSSTVKKLKSNYTLYEPAKLDSKENKDELIAMYPSITEQALYVLKSSTSSTNKEKIEGYFAEAGYTEEDYLTDMELVASVKSNDGAVFNVSMIYRLDGQDFLVEVPYSDIRCKSAYPITYISILPMFGASGTNENGYIFVPEGGGGLIAFNNGKLNQSAYYANLYGWDYGTERLEVVSETENVFPVFGMLYDDSSFFCVMESGSSFGGIKADISGRINSYNTVYGRYNVLHYDQYNVSAKTAQLVYMYESAIPNETVVQRYRFVPGSSYVDMARSYRDYLTDRYPALKDAAVSEDMPVFVELLGAIDKKVVKFGLPVTSVVPVTTFSQAGEIMDDLSSAGIRNMRVRISGWSNGGVRQKVLTGVKTLRELGGEKGMSSLITAAKEKNIPLYFDGVSCFAYNSGLFQGFVAFNNAARYTTREQVALYDYSTITFKQLDGDAPYYLVKPGYAKANMSNLISFLAKKNSFGIAFRDIGDLLSGDYNPKDTVNREEVLRMNIATIQEASSKGLGIVIKKGNDYAVPYADIVTDMNLKGNQYVLLDRSVPFYQIALHGLKEYTGESLTTSNDFHAEILSCAEYGAGLNLTLMSASGNILQETVYTGYYAASYGEIRDDLIAYATRYQKEMSGLNSQSICGHEYLTDKVTVTTYENGTRVFVNYGDTDYVWNDTVIPARDYLVKGEDQ